jgi:hypothetical protein
MILVSTFKFNFQCLCYSDLKSHQVQWVESVDRKDLKQHATINHWYSRSLLKVNALSVVPFIETCRQTKYIVIENINSPVNTLRIKKTVQVHNFDNSELGFQFTNSCINTQKCNRPAQFTFFVEFDSETFIEYALDSFEDVKHLLLTTCIKDNILFSMTTCKYSMKKRKTQTKRKQQMYWFHGFISEIKILF